MERAKATKKDGASANDLILRYLEESKKPTSTIGLSVFAGISMAETRKRLNKLKNQGFVAKVGETKVAYWRISEPKSLEQIKDFKRPVREL